MRTLYANRLPIVGQDDPIKRAQRVARTTWHWATRRWNTEHPQEDAGEIHPSTGCTVSWRTLTEDDRYAREITLTHPHADDPAVEVRAVVQVEGHQQGEVTATLRLSTHSTAEQIAPQRVDLLPPGLPQLLAKQFDVIIDGRRLDSAPSFHRAADVEPLVDYLRDGERSRPVIVVTTAPGSGQPVIDVSELARHLVGLAEVAVLKTHLALLAFGDLLGQDWSVVRGGIRIYWPPLGSDPRHHRYWTPTRVRERPESVERDVCQWVQRTAVTQFGTDRLSRAFQASSLQRLRAQIEDQGIIDEFIADFDALETRVGDLEHENAELLQELSEWRQRAEIAEKNLALVNAHRPEPDVQEAESSAVFDPERLDSVAEALEAAEQHHPELVVLETAHERARESSYERPEVVYEALTAIAEVSAAWRQDELAAGFRRAFEQRGWDWRSKLGRSADPYLGWYRLAYEGEIKLFEAHLGRGVNTPRHTFRIYMYPDRDNQTLAVGSVGPHGPTTES